MLQKLIKAAALAGFVLAATSSAFAASYTEAGDAGDIATGAAQMVTGNAGDAITSILGALTSNAGIYDGDAFKIYISSPSTFSASTTASNFTTHVNTFNSALSLFTLGGIGIVMSDDDPVSGGIQSVIPTSSFTASLAPGYYYLLITGEGMDPSSAGGLIFPSTTDPDADTYGLYGPTGLGGASPISGFAGSSNYGGAYSIALTGVTIAPAATVPEPSTLCLGLAGGLMLLGLRRRRHGKAAAQ